MQFGISNKDMLTWCDDLHTLKGSVSQLQSSLNTILSKAPSAIDYKLLERELETKNLQINERTKTLLFTPQAKVGIRLKELYNSEKLPFLSMLNKVNFKLANSDKWVGYLTDYTPPAGIGADLFEYIRGQKSNNSKSSTASYPPSLPPIENSSLLQRIFTDKSFRQPSDFIELSNLDDFSRRHNAKLSMKGKRILELALIEILDSKFPNLNEDDLYLLQFKLVNQTILTKFSFGYNFVKELKFATSIDGLTVPEKLNILGNVFLAYIGGLSTESLSFQEIKFWLSKLYSPIIEDIYLVLKQNNLFRPLENLAKTELDFLLGDKVQYLETPNDFDVFTIEIKYNGITIGIGSSRKDVEEAKINAAREVFENKLKLDEIFIAERKHHENEVKDSPSDTIMVDAEKREATFPSTSVNTTATATRSITKPVQSVSYYGAPPPPPGREIDPDNNVVTNGVKSFAKKNLHSTLAKHGLVPIYKYSHNNSEHMVTIVVDDIILARASAINKKIASQVAAQIAIGNKETLELLFTKVANEKNKKEKLEE